MTNYFRFSFFPSSLKEKNEAYWFEIVNRTMNDSKKEIISFSYYAFYYGGEDLRVYPIVLNANAEGAVVPYPGLEISSLIDGMDSDDLPLLAGKGLPDSWDLFYENAVFNNILDPATRPTRIIDVTHKQMLQEIGEALGGIDSGLYKDKFESTVIKLIRDKPYVLEHEAVRHHFIEILTLARWANDRGERTRASNLLKDHLVVAPERRGGRKPLLPEINYGLAEELLKSLARHLSRKCREVLGSGLFIDGRAHIYPEDEDYAELTKWAGNVHEYRLPKSQKSLNDLINNPSKFAKHLLTSCLKERKEKRSN